MVLGLYGNWGSGKSTILNYVEHHLENGADEQNSEKPIIVKFNPWWFSGKDHMARAFMSQFGATLSGKYKNSEMLLKSLSQLLDLSSGAGDYIGMGHLMRGSAKQIEERSKDINVTKNQIKEILVNGKKRILVLIDDMDRLAPDEVCQLLTVIKALADFPNTIYLLAFDPNVTSRAIKEYIKLPGDQYLEKIIQVPFHVPEVNHSDLSEIFFSHLPEYRDDFKLPRDRNRMRDYYGGIERLMRVPRDAVRLANAIKVCYPRVREKLSIIDFTSMQALRVFFPNLYKFIYSNRDAFLYGVAHDEQRVELYDRIEKQIPDDRLETVMHLLKSLFPNMESGNGERSAEHHRKWKQEGRVCGKDLFSIYFSLYIPSGHIGKDDIGMLLEAAGSSNQFVTALMGKKSAEKSEDISMARALVAELINWIPDDITSDKIWNIVAVLFDIGDQLVDSSKVNGWTDDSTIRISVVISKLLRSDQLQADEVHDILKSAISNGRAICAQGYHLVDGIERSSGNDIRSAYTATEINLDSLTEIWLSRVAELGKESILFQHPELPIILDAWWRWGDQAQQRKLRQSVDAAIEANSRFFRFLNQLLVLGMSNISSISTEYSGRTRQVVSFSHGIERYIDVDACANRLRDLREAGAVPSEFEETVSKFSEWYDDPDRESGDSRIEGS